MNSSIRLESELIVADQRRLHGAVAELDRRVDLLLQRIERDASVPAPEATLETALPPLPIVRAEQPKATKTNSSEPPAPPASSAAPTCRLTPQPARVERVEAAAPAPAQPEQFAEPLELRLGTYWMSRIGIVILLTGLVFLGNYAYHRFIGLLGPAGKLSLLALAGVALAGGGAWLEQSRESMRNFGRVLLGGGAAALYYTVYAAHFVERLRVIESPLLGGSLLLFVAGGIGWIAERRREETIALIAILLSYYTSAINPIGGFTLWSNLLLTAVATSLLVRHRWVRITGASLVATYGSYGYWRIHELIQTGTSDQTHAGIGFLAAYWLLFTFAVFAVKAEEWSGSKRAGFLSLNNAAFFAYGAFHFVATQQRDEFWLFSGALGVVMLGLAAFAARRYRELSSIDGAYLVQGLLLITLALVLRLTGPQLAVVLAVQSGALLGCHRLRHGVVYEAAAALTAAASWLLTLSQMSAVRMAPATVGSAVALVLLGNAIASKLVFRASREESGLALSTFAYGLLSLSMGGLVIWKSCPAEFQPAIFAGIALSGLLFARVRLPEIAAITQAFAPISAGLIAVRSIAGPLPSGWTVMAVAGATIALSHAWQLTQAALSQLIRSAVALGLALCAACAVLAWNFAAFSGEQWLLVTCALSLGTMIYGLATRTWSVAAAGQVFTVAAAASFAVIGSLVAVRAGVALAPIAVVAATALLISRFAALRWRDLGSKSQHTDVAAVYRGVTLLLVGAWITHYVPRLHWCSAYLLSGTVLMAAGALTSSRLRSGFGFAYIWLGFLLSCLPGQTHWLDLISILAVPALLRTLRHFRPACRETLPAPTALEAAATASTCLWVTRATIEAGWGGQLTVAWALLGLVLLALGLLSRIRLDRLSGLAIVTLALGRLFVFDVWRFDTLYRILSFLALGTVLLVISFLYHRLAEKLRSWM